MKVLFTDGGDPTAEVIVRSIRMPRVVAALLAGACFGVSGALIQSATRNPLGDPQLFGLGGGAAIVQALALAGVVNVGAWGLTSLSVAAGLAGAMLIFLLASRESLTPARLALVGVSIGALTLAVAAAILTHTRVFSLQALSLFSGSLAEPGMGRRHPGHSLPCSRAWADGTGGGSAEPAGTGGQACVATRGESEEHPGLRPWLRPGWQPERV